MKLADFDYDLPQEAIALAPASPRDAARLLDLQDNGLHDRHIRDLPNLLNSGDILVVNNTEVIPARLSGKRGEARISVTLHKRELAAGKSNVWRVFAKPAKKCRPDDVIIFGDDFAALVHGRGAGGDVELGFVHPDGLSPLDEVQILQGLETYGEMPLPPYIARPDGATKADADDYQTMFAAEQGAVAAPTAGLHFTNDLVAALAAKNIQIAPVTLHVGAGTFLPVTVDDIADHQMHSEWGHISAETAAMINQARQNGGRVIAVGTTSLRIMEACYAALGRLDEFSDETDIFITPGYKFRSIDMLLTNFHLPKSTLLMLVSALVGLAPIRDAYSHAIASGYRFFSYGDACLLPNNSAGVTPDDAGDGGRNA